MKMLKINFKFFLKDRPFFSCTVFYDMVYNLDEKFILVMGSVFYVPAALSGTLVKLIVTLVHE